MRNHMMICKHGRVSVLVFETPGQRLCMGELLAGAAPEAARIAVGPDGVTAHEMRAAIAESLRMAPSTSVEAARDEGVCVACRHLEHIGMVCGDPAGPLASHGSPCVCAGGALSLAAHGDASAGVVAPLDRCHRCGGTPAGHLENDGRCR